MKHPLFARYQRAADLVWPRLMGGCRVQRRTQEAIRRTQEAIGWAFRIEACRGFRFPPFAAFSPLGPRVRGVARKA